MTISYLKGDVTEPKGSGPRIIAHICNDRGGFGKGVALAIANRWPEAKTYFKRWYASKDEFALGKTQIVFVASDLWVCNMVAQHGYKTASNPHPLQLDALRKCLRQLHFEAESREALICMPRIGTGLAGSSWDVIEPMLRETLGNQEVYIYEL